MRPIHSRLTVGFWRTLLASGLALLFLLLLASADPAPNQSRQVMTIEASSSPAVMTPLAAELEAARSV